MVILIVKAPTVGAFEMYLESRNSSSSSDHVVKTPTVWDTWDARWSHWSAYSYSYSSILYLTHYVFTVFNLIRPGLVSRLPGRGRGLRGLDTKNQSYRQPIEMKLCLSQYSHKNMPDAKFESGGFSSFGGMTSQNFPLKRGSHKLRIFTLGKWV